MRCPYAYICIGKVHFADADFYANIFHFDLKVKRADYRMNH